MKGLVLLAILCAFVWGEDVYATFISQGVRESALKLNASGIVESISVDVGDSVKKGDVLLHIQNNIQKENVNIQQAQTNAQEQLYLFQKNQFERYEQSKTAIDKNTYEQIYYNFKKTQSDLDTAQATLAYQREILANTYLRAPFDGVIAEKSVELGDGITQNSTTLFRLISREVKLILEFDSKYATKVKVGDIYVFSVDSAANKQEAKITKVYPSVDSATRKVKAEVMVKGIMSGVFGDGYIRTK